MGPSCCSGRAPLHCWPLTCAAPAKVQHMPKSGEKDLLCSCLEAWKHLAFSACWLLIYLGDLLPAALGRRPPWGSVALVVKTNVFYHPFHRGMKARIEITQLLPWWAAGKPPSLPQHASTWGHGDWQNEATAPLAAGFASWRPAAPPALLSVDGGSHTWGHCTQKPPSMGSTAQDGATSLLSESSTKVLQNRQGRRHAAWAAQHSSRGSQSPLQIGQGSKQQGGNVATRAKGQCWQKSK